MTDRRVGAIAEKGKANRKRSRGLGCCIGTHRPIVPKAFTLDYFITYCYSSKSSLWTSEKSSVTFLCSFLLLFEHLEVWKGFITQFRLRRITANLSDLEGRHHSVLSCCDLSDAAIMFSITSSPVESPITGMMRNWLSFMIPMALVTWKHTCSIPAAIGSFVLAPTIAILQGAFCIIRYRVLNGDAPLPLSPAHGVVVVNPNGGEEIAPSCAHKEHFAGCSCLGGRRWRNTTHVSDSERQLLAKALKEPPLRLLVIGDSLAMGVGTSQSCTPLLPEVIARTLSKARGGRAVYWTCHGEPGASAGWIVRELERGMTKGNATLEEQLSSCDASVSEDETVSDSSSEEEELDPLPVEWKTWRERLHRHRKRFDPEVLGPYDIAVVFSGANDLKSAFFPFLLTGEDAKFRKQAKERGGSYPNELRRVLDVLRYRMKEGMEEICDNILDALHSSSPRSSKKKQVEAATNDSTSNGTQTCSGNGMQSTQLLQHEHAANAPLIVLPGLPARTLPIFQKLPLRWLAVPVVDKLDDHKRQLAKSHPDEVIFVEAPTVESIVQYENQSGPIWQQRQTEDTLLALRDVNRRTCRRIETDMYNYYSEFENLSKESPLEMPQHNAPVPPLAERPGKAGSKIFSRDQIHPNDEGYDYWGRYIASAIVDQWKAT